MEFVYYFPVFMIKEKDEPGEAVEWAGQSVRMEGESHAQGVVVFTDEELADTYKSAVGSEGDLFKVESEDNFIEVLEKLSGDLFVLFDKTAEEAGARWTKRVSDVLKDLKK